MERWNYLRVNNSEVVVNMIPILYSSTATDFTNNGYGRLADCTSCIVTEERNGDYLLELTYPVNGKYFEHLAVDSIIGAKPNKEVDVEHFRVISVNATSLGSVTVVARQIALETMRTNVYLGRPGYEFGYSNLGEAADYLWQNDSAITNRLPGANDPATFPPLTFYSDITATDTDNLPPVDFAFQWNNALVGNKGSFIDKCGGELSYHDLTVSILSARGSDKGVKLVYGKNITGIQQTIDYSDTYDGFIPYITLSEPYECNTIVASLTTYPYKDMIIYSPYRGTYAHNRILALDVNALMVTDSQGNINYDSTWTAAKNYIDQHPEWGLPDITTTVQFVPLGQTEEYRHLAEFESLSLCDTVLVYFPALGVNKSAKVVKTVYNTLREKYDSIEIGTLRQTLAQTIANIKRGR